MTIWRVELVWAPDSGELTDAALVELSDAAHDVVQGWNVARWELTRGLLLVTLIGAESCVDATVRVAEDAVAWLAQFPAMNPGRVVSVEAMTPELRQLRVLGQGMTVNEAREAMGLEPFPMIEPLPWLWGKGLNE